MKSTRIVLLAGASLGVGWAAGTWRGKSGRDRHTLHSGVTIEQVQALSSLVTAKVDVSDVQETRLDGYTGGVKVVLLIKGDFLLGVDLSRAKFEAVDAPALTAVLLLPQPKASGPRLDHERTRVFAVSQSGLWQIAPGGGQTSGEVIDRGYLYAQRFVAAASNDPALIAQARRQAEQVLVEFLRATGWHVSVRWID